MIAIVVTAGVSLCIGIVIGAGIMVHQQKKAIAEWETNNSKQQ